MTISHPSRPRRPRAALIPTSDDGMTTAEYAVGTIAACAFAGVLLKVVTSSAVSGLLAGVVERALSSAT